MAGDVSRNETSAERADRLLPPTAQKALRVLDRDGQIAEQEMILRLRPAYPEACRSVIRQLTEAGLIATDDEGVIRRA